MTNDDRPRPQRQDYEDALRSMDTFIDIGVEDLMTLAQRAEQLAGRRVIAGQRVRDLMTSDVVCVTPQTRMGEAAHLLVSRRISGLPVVDADAQLVGIVTEADFLGALGVPARQPPQNVWHTLESLFRHMAERPPGPQGPEGRVADHMTHEVVTIGPDQDLQQLLDLMKQHRVKRVLVCDSQRRVLGIVTRSDLVKAFFERYALSGEGDTA